MFLSPQIGGCGLSCPPANADTVIHKLERARNAGGVLTDKSVVIKEIRLNASRGLIVDRQGQRNDWAIPSPATAGEPTNTSYFE